MKIRWLFSNILLLIIIFSFNNAFAKQLPLTNNSAWHIASVLNSPKAQALLEKNTKIKLGKLSPLVLEKKDNNNCIYKAYVDGGSDNNGEIKFVEDLNGRIYDIAYICDKNDKEMFTKSMGVVSFYLMIIGVNDKTISSLMDNLKMEGGIGVSQIWDPVLKGFLTCRVGFVKNSPNKLMSIFSLYSEKYIR